jgi:hypothetical protein
MADMAAFLVMPDASADDGIWQFCPLFELHDLSETLE